MRWDTTLTPVMTNEGNFFWEVELTFSTKPAPDAKNCQKNQVEDPLQIPPKISGKSIKYNEEATFTKDGVPIVNTAFEQIRGPQVEFDKNRSQVKIEFNSPTLDLGLCQGMVDSVNESELWGFPARHVKLSDFEWERKFYGTCYPYYTKIFTFDIRYTKKNFTFSDEEDPYDSFDRDVLSEGYMALRGDWDTDKNSPTFGLYILDFDVNPAAPNLNSFARFRDFNGDISRTLLTKQGLPVGWNGNESVNFLKDQAAVLHIEYYPENEFLLLGIPPSLESV
jgi:hypothetical protein